MCGSNIKKFKDLHSVKSQKSLQNQILKIFGNISVDSEKDVINLSKKSIQLIKQEHRSSD